MVKQVKDVEAESSPSAGTGRGGTSAPDKVWIVGGRLQVRESEIDGEPRDRPLKGIEVKVSARDTTIVPWTSWGTVRTDADGDFTLQEAKNGKSRFLRVRARLAGGDLEVNDSKLDDLASFDDQGVESALRFAAVRRAAGLVERPVRDLRELPRQPA
jgi:hypothetical protein